jgi:2,4-dienoyl-CoA reductase-like NADH-dependent reductase (Old Yellow Enzyme family)
VPSLFEPFTLRGVTARNRAWVSPMCQYRAVDGVAQDWHLVHLGSLARGGAGLVMAEATAVLPAGRISPQDLGLWDDGQVGPLARIVDFVRAQGAVAGIQLAHAGRKGSSYRPWSGRGTVPPSAGGWPTVAPSALAFGRSAPPREMTVADIDAVVAAWAAAAGRALAAGFDVVEVHAAHGYLLHEFLSPLSNRRTDAYGGSLANRARLLLRVVAAVRQAWPADRPLFVRFSGTDWVPGGWDVEQCAQVARWCGEQGADLVDVSSGGLDPAQQIPVGPGYQVPLAAQLRAATGLPTVAVGLITTGPQAQQVLDAAAADAVMIGRAMLRDTAWALHAARELGIDVPWPSPYARVAELG